MVNECHSINFDCSISFQQKDRLTQIRREAAREEFENMNMVGRCAKSFSPFNFCIFFSSGEVTFLRFFFFFLTNQDKAYAYGGSKCSAQSLLKRKAPPKHICICLISISPSVL